MNQQAPSETLTRLLQSVADSVRELFRTPESEQVRTRTAAMIEYLKAQHLLLQGAWDLSARRT